MLSICGMTTKMGLENLSFCSPTDPMYDYSKAKQAVCACFSSCQWDIIIISLLMNLDWKTFFGFLSGFGLVFLERNIAHYVSKQHLSPG